MPCNSILLQYGFIKQIIIINYIIIIRRNFEIHWNSASIPVWEDISYNPTKMDCSNFLGALLLSQL